MDLVTVLKINFSESQKIEKVNNWTNYIDIIRDPTMFPLNTLGRRAFRATVNLKTITSGTLAFTAGYNFPKEEFNKQYQKVHKRVNRQIDEFKGMVLSVKRDFCEHENKMQANRLYRWQRKREFDAKVKKMKEKFDAETEKQIENKVE